MRWQPKCTRPEFGKEFPAGGPEPTLMRRLLYLAGIAVLPFVLILLARGATGLASRILERRYPPPGRMVPVGNYRLQLFCSGSGSPTIIIEPGMGVDWVGWRLVIPQLAAAHRVCVYDRAGYGWSDAGPMPRTALRESGELHLLLTRAGIAPPYLLVAHSFGGYIARLYASQFAGTLAGVVLVDPSLEDEPATAHAPRQPQARRLRDLIPPLGIERLKRMDRGDEALPGDLRHAPPVYRERYLIASSLAQLAAEHSEFTSLDLTWAQVRRAVFPRDLPLTVITAVHLGRADVDPTELPAEHRELQARLAHSSRFGRQIIARRSGHMVPLDEPQVIVDAVREIIAPPRLMPQDTAGFQKPL